MIIEKELLRKSYGSYLGDATEELFDFFKRELNKSHREGKKFVFAYDIRKILEENLSVYFNEYVQNIHSLNKNKKYYKELALEFLKKNIDEYFELFEITKDKTIFITLIKFLPQSGVDYGYFIKLLELFATVVKKDDFSQELKELAKKGFLRYDCKTLANEFFNFNYELEPYKELNLRIKEDLDGLKKDDKKLHTFIALSDSNYRLYKDRLKDEDILLKTLREVVRDDEFYSISSQVIIHHR